MIKNKVLSLIFKIVIICLGIYGLLLSSGLTQGTFHINMLYYFTNLSNIMVVIYFIGEVIYLLMSNNDAHPTWLPRFKHMCVISIMVTCLIAHFMLHMPLTTELLLLHYVVPIMTVLDWLLFDEKGVSDRFTPYLSILPPYIYIIYTYIRMTISHSNLYPYPFLDIPRLGLIKVIITVVALTIAFIILGYGLCLIDNKLKSKDRKYY